MKEHEWTWIENEWSRSPQGNFALLGKNFGVFEGQGVGKMSGKTARRSYWCKLSSRSIVQSFSLHMAVLCMFRFSLVAFLAALCICCNSLDDWERMSHGHCQCLKPEILLSLCFKIVTQPHGQLFSNYEKEFGFWTWDVFGHFMNDVDPRCIEAKTWMPTPIHQAVFLSLAQEIILYEVRIILPTTFRTNCAMLAE